MDERFSTSRRDETPPGTDRPVTARPRPEQGALARVDALSGKLWLRVLIAAACLLGLAGSVALAFHLRDVGIFYKAGGGVAMALFFSWVFDVWKDEEQSGDNTALAHQVAEKVLERIGHEPTVGPLLTGMNAGDYKKLEQELRAVIEAELE
jgi:hypothetical protein